MSTALARKYRIDVTTDKTLAGSWVELKGVTDFDPEVAPNIENADDYSTSGWSNSEVTMQAWTATATFFRKIVAGTYDPGQEITRACVGQFDAAARVGFRWYDKLGGPEANSGVALVAWKRANTAVTNLEQATLTFTGTDAPLNMNITNPFAPAVAPVVLAATPSGAAAGAQVVISGTGFTGTVVTTGVKFASVNATSWVVVSDQTIVAIVPTGSAGSAPITVTNATGVSNSLAYTRA